MKYFIAKIPIFFSIATITLFSILSSGCYSTLMETSLGKVFSVEDHSTKPPFHKVIHINTVIHIVSDPTMFDDSITYRFRYNKNYGEYGFYDLTTKEVWCLGYYEEGAIQPYMAVLGHEIQHYLENHDSDIRNPDK